TKASENTAIWLFNTQIISVFPRFVYFCIWPVYITAIDQTAGSSTLHKNQSNDKKSTPRYPDGPGSSRLARHDHERRAAGGRTPGRSGAVRSPASLAHAGQVGPAHARATGAGRAASRRRVRRAFVYRP